MTEFEVRGELDALGGGYVAICDKDHIGDRATWEYGAADELADEVDGAMLICDGHDDAIGDEEDGAQAESEEKSIPREMNRVADR